MNSWRAVIAVWLLFFSTVYAGPASAASDDARQLWQLLDYVAVDYGGAVANGTVISEAEYAEMKDFTEKATKQVQALPAHASKDAIAAAIGELRAAVLRKADGTEVARLAQQANALLLAAYPMPVAPRALPDLTRGGALYIAQCASCHGAAGRGDGRLAASLEPKPIAGVAGTSMPSFSSLSEEDRWALAFYIGTMSHDGAMRGRGEKLWRQDASVKRHFPDLATVSTMTEAASAKLMPQCRRDQHV